MKRNLKYKMSKITRLWASITEKDPPKDETSIYILKHVLNSIDSAIESLQILKSDNAKTIEEHANQLKQCTTFLFQGMMINNVARNCVANDDETNTGLKEMDQKVIHKGVTRDERSKRGSKGQGRTE